MIIADRLSTYAFKNITAQVNNTNEFNEIWKLNIK